MTSPAANVAFLLWGVAALGLFARFPGRRALCAGLIGGWLFLPMAEISLQGFPDLDKRTVLSLGLLLGALLFDRAALRGLRPSWLDAPIIVWCAVPFASSLTNSLGAYDGLSTLTHRVLVWGIPYVLGRAYFRKLEDLRELALATVVGGLIYVPLCVAEILMGPQLHRLVYGYTQHELRQAWRLGGWRPMVFMEHGLMVGLWMAVAGVSAVWMARAGTLFRRGTVDWLVAMLLVATTVAVKSLNGWFLVALGIGLLLVSSHWKTRLPVWALIAAIVLYPALRIAGFWSPEAGETFARIVLTEKRDSSLVLRFWSEDRLVDRALERPWVGWGGWGRQMVSEIHPVLNDPVVTDSRWIIAFGRNGLVGLAALLAMLLLPTTLFTRRLHPRTWTEPAVAAAAALAVVPLLWATDNLVNDMRNPVFLVILGALATVAAAHPGTGLAVPEEPSA